MGVSQVSGIEQVRHTRSASLAAHRSTDLIGILDGPKRRSPWLPIGWYGLLPSHDAFLPSSLGRSIIAISDSLQVPNWKAAGRPRTSLITCPHVRNNPINYSDPTGHFACGDGIEDERCEPSDAKASNFGDLLKLGIDHVPSAIIVGEGLQNLQNDPSVKGAQRDIIKDIRSDPRYGKQSFNFSVSEPEDFTANGPDGNWLTGARTGNPSFWMVHTANLFATYTKVTADGTISTTWKVEDQFDYIPDWEGRVEGLKTDPVRYFAYNGFAQLIAPIYHGLLQATPYRTYAYWDDTIPPEWK
jgi:hypothetical protein